MFYSHLLLSKKGALGVVWMAAHCHTRLKKHQVRQTSIPSSVDKILDDEVPVVAHRILAFLLLGVVRIYSKKVEYLFHDCHLVLNELQGSKIREGRRLSIEASTSHYQSITLPKRFELDAFDLEQSESEHILCGEWRSEDTVMLEDASQNDGDTHGFISKAIVPFSEASSKACTPARDVFSPHHMAKDLIARTGICLAGGVSLCLEDRLDPMSLDEGEEDQMCNNHREIVPQTTLAGPSLETLLEHQFSSHNHVDPMVLDETEKQQTEDMPSNDHARINFPGQVQDAEFDPVTRPSPQGSDLVAISGAFNKSGYFLEHPPNFEILSSAEKEQGIKLHVSVVTPDSKLAEGGIPEDANVWTPATKEPRKILKRRKMPFDQNLIVPNEVYKNWIENDSSDLKRKRRKIPLTLLHAWRVTKLRRTHDNFFDPLVSGTSLDLSSLAFPAAVKPVQLSPSRHEVGSPRDIQNQIPDVGIAPENPVATCANPFESRDQMRDVAAPHILVSTVTPESIEKFPTSNELVSVFQEGTIVAFDGDSLERDSWSAGTRTTQGFLRQKFLDKKRENKEPVLKMWQLLQNSSKEESARFFYEILVLKTRECIDVEQAFAYDDIVLRPKLPYTD